MFATEHDRKMVLSIINLDENKTQLDINLYGIYCD